VTLVRFPRRTHRGDAVLHRIHWQHHAPWWFSADGRGRFDPVGTGSGACYLAEEPLGAWVEVFRTAVLLDQLELDARRLTRLLTGTDLRLADLTSRRALQFGVTASLGADRDYAASQAFAVRALDAGFAGVRYLVRHDPAQRLHGVALFGPAETSDAPGTATSGPIPAELADQARARFRYRIAEHP
jgi:RES domain-containing protein